MPKDRSCQLKIGNLEKQVYNILKKVQKPTQFVKHNAILDFTETRRRKFPPGYYPLTIHEQGNESHGVLIEKRITPSGMIRFYIFDPNGKKWANRSGYTLKIRIGDKFYPIYKNISPDKSWNKSGNCGLWNIVMTIVFERDDIFNQSRLKKLYGILNKHGDNWMNQLQDDLIVNVRTGYNTKSEAEMFIDAVYGKIAELLASA